MSIHGIHVHVIYDMHVHVIYDMHVHVIYDMHVRGLCSVKNCSHVWTAVSNFYHCQ